MHECLSSGTRQAAQRPEEGEVGGTGRESEIVDTGEGEGFGNQLHVS